MVREPLVIGPIVQIRELSEVPIRVDCLRKLTVGPKYLPLVLEGGGIKRSVIKLEQLARFAPRTNILFTPSISLGHRRLPRRPDLLSI